MVWSVVDVVHFLFITVVCSECGICTTTADSTTVVSLPVHQRQVHCSQFLWGDVVSSSEFAWFGLFVQLLDMFFVWYVMQVKLCMYSHGKLLMWTHLWTTTSLLKELNTSVTMPGIHLLCHVSALMSGFLLLTKWSSVVLCILCVWQSCVDSLSSTAVNVNRCDIGSIHRNSVCCCHVLQLRQQSCHLSVDIRFLSTGFDSAIQEVSTLCICSSMLVLGWCLWHRGRWLQ